MENREMFKEVIGHQEQIECLINVINWFKESEKYNDLELDIPRGIILYGEPGNGKSLIMRLLKNYLNDIPCYVFNHDSKNVIQELNNIFKKASSDKKAVVIIDEIDLLIDNDFDITRCLQENLDGVEEICKNILVVTACNHIHSVPKPLLRSGRLSKKILIDNPNLDEIEEFFIKLANKFGFDENLIDDELLNAFEGFSFVEIKNIINETILRKGSSDITSDDLIDEISINEDGIIRKRTKSPFNVAIHEAGHAIMSLKYPESFKLGNIKINGGSGYCICKLENDNSKHSDILKRAEVYLAGRAAEKLFYKEGNIGCQGDVENARHLVYSIVNTTGYLGMKYILPEGHNDNNSVSNFKLYKNERKEAKLLNKLDKKVYKYLKTQKNLIFNLAQEIFKKGFMSSKEIKTFIENYNNHSLQKNNQVTRINERKELGYNYLK